MPLFKKVNIEVKGQKRAFKIMFDGSGAFYCEPGLDISNAFGGVEYSKVIGSNFDEVFNRLHKVIRDFNELNTQRVYTIHYRFHLSQKIKTQMPKELMTPEMWKKTSHAAGSNQYYADDIGVKINWYPCVTEILGESSILTKLKPAEIEDMKFIEGGTYFPHKPYSDLIFVSDGRIWDFYKEEKYFTIPLTAETFEFFNGIEASFVAILTKMLGFLSQDQAVLMETISKMALESRSQFLIGK